MNPQNGIIGDVSGIDLPQAAPEADLLAEERKMARYSKTGEFKRIQEHFNNRIKFYQEYLPDGRPVATATTEEINTHWRVANLIIGEFNQVINMFETAAEAVKDASK